MVNRQPKKVVNNTHWGSLAKGYLNLARIGFSYLKEKKNIGRKKFFLGQKPIYDLVDGNTIVAGIWNIKHGLEIIIKGLGIQLDKKYWINHDLKYLLKDLEGKIKDFCLKEDLDSLKKLIDKYYNCKFTPKTIHADIDNTYFKYPETNTGSLQYSFVHDLKRRDINQFIRDIRSLSKIYDVIESQRSWFQQAPQVGISKKQVVKMLKDAKLKRKI